MTSSTEPPLKKRTKAVRNKPLKPLRRTLARHWRATGVSPDQVRSLVRSILARSATPGTDKALWQDTSHILAALLTLTSRPRGRISADYIEKRVKSEVLAAAPPNITPFTLEWWHRTAILLTRLVQQRLPAPRNRPKKKAGGLIASAIEPGTGTVRGLTTAKLKRFAQAVQTFADKDCLPTSAAIREKARDLLKKEGAQLSKQERRNLLRRLRYIYAVGSKLLK